MKPLPVAFLAFILVAGGSLAIVLPTPTYDTMDLVKRISHGSAGGLWYHDGYTYSSGLGSGFFITDVRDPENPVKMGAIGGPNMRDADFLGEINGRKIVVTARGNNEMFFIDVTNPAAPTVVRNFNVGATVHNLAALRGENLVYNSRGGLSVTNPRIDIIDASNPASPVVVKRWFPNVDGVELPIPWGGCHDVTVFPEVDRAYCAGGVSSMILDISDPLDPQVISVIENPMMTLHHSAMPNADHTVLILGDEYGGTIAPGCIASVTTPVNTVSTPTGALFFYDITVPQAPALLGWVSPPTFAGTPCTAHFGTIVGNEDVLALGFYRAGVLLVDFTIPAVPRILDIYRPDDANVWDVQYADGYLFTGNIGRGMDVLRLS